jgi:hypothetical protein
MRKVQKKLKQDDYSKINGKRTQKRAIGVETEKEKLQINKIYP